MYILVCLLNWLLITSHHPTFGYILIQLTMEASQFSNRGGAPIGAGGVITPHFSRQSGMGGGHNLGIIHISHIALITPLH